MQTALKNYKSLKDHLEYTDRENLTPLLIAAKDNHFEIVKFLIESKANPYV